MVSFSDDWYTVHGKEGFYEESESRKYKWYINEDTAVVYVNILTL